MKSRTIIIASVLAAALVAHAAPTVSPGAAPWKDVSNCAHEARGTVVTAKDAKVGGKAVVRVTAKAAFGGNLLKAGFDGAKASDFPVGSDFCKIDLGAD